MSVRAPTYARDATTHCAVNLRGKLSLFVSFPTREHRRTFAHCGKRDSRAGEHAVNNRVEKEGCSSALLRWYSVLLHFQWRHSDSHYGPGRPSGRKEESGYVCYNILAYEYCLVWDGGRLFWDWKGPLHTPLYLSLQDKNRQQNDNGRRQATT